MTDEPQPPKRPYKTGYKKPPQDKQWKPGVSGNPRGRPRKKQTVDNFYDAVIQAMQRYRKVQRGDTVLDMTTYEIGAEKLAEMLMRGDKKAFDIVLKIDRPRVDIATGQNRQYGVLLVGMSGEPTPEGKAKGLTLLEELEEQQAPFRNSITSPDDKK